MIRTTGDMIQDRALSEAGGKGLFTKELDNALLGGAIDFAIHSAKDLPTVLPDGIVIAGYLPREDVRDVLIAQGRRTLLRRCRKGRASARRRCAVRRSFCELRPDLRVGSAARQCADPPGQGGVGRVRGNAAGPGRPEAPRPRSTAPAPFSTLLIFCPPWGRARSP